eukprot:5039741-Ditylum_brightwellii.AAC.1
MFQGNTYIYSRSCFNCKAIATTFHPTASCHQRRKVGSDGGGGERGFVGRWEVFAVGDMVD